MSRVIKQNYVAISTEKKIIQNTGQFQAITPLTAELKETAAMRVVQEVADSLQIESESSQDHLMSEEQNSSFDLSSYEAEAERILAEANSSKNKIYEDAYKAGMEKAKEELERRAMILEKEYFAKREALEKELAQKHKQQYDQEIRQLEGKMLLWLQGMLSKLVGQAQKNEKVLIHLIRMGMQEISLQGDLIIRVSEEDLDYVLENKTELTEELSEKLTIEVLKDKNLKKNQCIIETIMGNIECSLDVQLKGIIDELRLIYESIMKNVHVS